MTHPVLRPALCRTLPHCPDLLALHAAHPARYPYLLESAAPGPQARYDVLLAFPQARLELAADGRLWGAAIGRTRDFFSALDDAWRGAATASQGHSDLPFSGGWFLYLGYELAGQIEPSLRLPRAIDPLPTALAVRCPAALVHDRQRRCTYAVAEADHAELLNALLQDAAVHGTAPGPSSTAPLVRAAYEEDPGRYLAAIARALDYINAGDTFQVNLSRAWHAGLTCPVTDAELYARLRCANPAPFAALAVLREGCTVLSSSPERLVRVRDGIIETRPIAGTRPRAMEPAADRRLREELATHPKERAEHVMLIDLERNDLGRVCRPGSIRVDELLVLESYAHVHHLVSNVRGMLRPEITPGAVLRALFPGGTITGCPKVRCMEILAELEGVGRGAYTGALGYLNHDGSMDLNILIRSLVRIGDHIGFRTGAGIVADSQPLRELEETRAKAHGLVLALVRPGDKAPFFHQ